MGERRNRKSFWDTEDETKHMSGMREHNSWAGKDHHSSHGSGRYHEFSDSRTTSTRDSRDHSGSGWPSWESIEENPPAPMSHIFSDAYEGKEMGGGKRYHKNISPGFEEMELHDYNHTHEYERSHSQRYMGKGRSRSRSRSRTQGRSQSRSLSRGRERKRVRERAGAGVEAEVMVMAMLMIPEGVTVLEEIIDASPIVGVTKEVVKKIISNMSRLCFRMVQKRQPMQILSS